MVTSTEQSYQKLIKRIANNIKTIRKSKGLSQVQMEKFGFDLRNYQRIESGSHSPSLFTLFKIAEALNIELSDLLKKPS